MAPWSAPWPKGVTGGCDRPSAEHLGTPDVRFMFCFGCIWVYLTARIGVHFGGVMKKYNSCTGINDHLGAWLWGL